MSVTNCLSSPLCQKNPKTVSIAVTLAAIAITTLVVGILGLLSVIHNFYVAGITLTSISAATLLVDTLWLIALFVQHKSKQEVSESSITSDKKVQETQKKQINWWTERELEKNIENIQLEYQKNPLAEGYIIQIKEEGTHVSPKGGKRSEGARLMGVPNQHPTMCNFCNPPVPAVKEFSEHDCHLIASRSNTPLLIPDKEPIPIHWLQADEGVQLELLNAAQSMLNTFHHHFPKDQFYIEMHCGSPGAQTVWHLHVRIHRVGGWSSINWKQHFE